MGLYKLFSHELLKVLISNSLLEIKSQVYVSVFVCAVVLGGSWASRVSCVTQGSTEIVGRVSRSWLKCV